MDDENKSKDQLIRELNNLRQIVSELKTFKLEHEAASTAFGESENRYKITTFLSFSFSASEQQTTYRKQGQRCWLRNKHYIIN